MCINNFIKYSSKMVKLFLVSRFNFSLLFTLILIANCINCEFTSPTDLREDNRSPKFFYIIHLTYVYLENNIEVIFLLSSLQLFCILQYICPSCDAIVRKIDMDIIKLLEVFNFS